MLGSSVTSLITNGGGGSGAMSGGSDPPAEVRALFNRLLRFFRDSVWLYSDRQEQLWRHATSSALYELGRSRPFGVCSTGLPAVASELLFPTLGPEVTVGPSGGSRSRRPWLSCHCRRNPRATNATRAAAHAGRHSASAGGRKRHQIGRAVCCRFTACITRCRTTLKLAASSDSSARSFTSTWLAFSSAKKR